MSEEQVQPQLALERIYTKDISFEVPGAQVFTKQWQPELNINLSSAAEKIDPNHYEVSLKVVVQANNAGETAFIVDVTQAGIFLVDEVEEERRVLYVALTRAKNELILTKQNLSIWARDQVDDQGRKIESYFLNDLTRNLCTTETHYKTRQQTVKSALIERKTINLDFGIDLD